MLEWNTSKIEMPFGGKNSYVVPTILCILTLPIDFVAILQSTPPRWLQIIGAIATYSW